MIVSILDLLKVGKIYTLIFSFFSKKNVNIAFLELRPLSNEKPGNFTIYRGIQEFLETVFFYFT